MPMGFMDRLKAMFGGGGADQGREKAAADEARAAAPGGDRPPEAQAGPEPATGVAQKGTAATGVGTGDPVPGTTETTDPAVQSASAGQTPEEQREAAAGDPASTSEPGTEGQDQEPR
jgi:hypothetical protein